MPKCDAPLTLDRKVHFHGHVATILPVDPARKAGALARQFRLSPFLDGGDGWLWEIPGNLSLARKARAESPER